MKKSNKIGVILLVGFFLSSIFLTTFLGNNNNLSNDQAINCLKSSTTA